MEYKEKLTMTEDANCTYSPEMRFLGAMLKRAVQDLWADEHLYRENAKAWFFTGIGKVSFEYVCEGLGKCPHRVRKGLAENNLL